MKRMARSDLTTQLKAQAGSQKTPMSVLKASPFLTSSSLNIYESQTQNLILQVAELQYRLNSQPCHVLHMTLIEKDWNSENQSK